MASEPKRAGKTEVLSMRMDPKTRFMVDILAKYRGQSISTVVERAILEAADNATIHSNGKEKTWRDFWHVSEGVRALNIAAEQSLYPTFEDEYRLSFTRTHWPFFYYTASCALPRPAYVEILWPRMEEFLDTWEKTQSKDWFATGKLMRQAITDAGVAAPEWPIPREPPKTAAVPAKSPVGGPSWDAPKGGDLDDEIPF
jgi:hypothetical protein